MPNERADGAGQRAAEALPRARVESFTADVDAHAEAERRDGDAGFDL